MTKRDRRISRTVIGIALTLMFVLITAVFSMVPPADAVRHHHGNGKKKAAAVQGTVGLDLQPVQQNSVKASPANPESPASPGNQGSSTLTITLNLRNIPKGEHRADIHQGTCPLNFSLNGQPPANGPFTPGVTLPLGNVQAKADGTLNKKLTFQVGGSTGIPTTLLQGGWFFCIHTGTLAQLQGSTPDELAASLGTFLKTKEGPGQVKQLVCQALNGTVGQNSLTIHVNGAQKGGPPTPAPAPAPEPAPAPAPAPEPPPAPKPT